MGRFAAVWRRRDNVAIFLGPKARKTAENRVCEGTEPRLLLRFVQTLLHRVRLLKPRRIDLKLAARLLVVMEIWPGQCHLATLLSRAQTL